MALDGTCTATFEMEVCFALDLAEYFRPRIALLYSEFCSHMGNVIVKFNDE